LSTTPLPPLPVWHVFAICQLIPKLKFQQVLSLRSREFVLARTSMWIASPSSYQVEDSASTAIMFDNKS
jgi:hypothetical protein